MKSLLLGSLLLIFSFSVFAQGRDYSDAECKDGVQMMRTGADKCLGMENFDQRAKCFDDISQPVSQKYGNEFFEGPKCRPGMDELKSEVLDKEKKAYPKQASALEANRGGDRGPGPGPGDGNRRTYTDAECREGTNMMRQGADRCLNMKDFNQRAKCFDDISRPVSQKYGNEFFEGPKCRPGLNALKAEVESKEKSRYPSQGSAIEAHRSDDHNRGPGGPGDGGKRREYSTAECKDGTNMMRKGADRCLKMKDFNQRARCFDDISKPVSQKYGHDFFEGPKCRPGLNALKAEVVAKEKANFPDQGSAIEAHRGGGDHRGPGGPGNGRGPRSYSSAECKAGTAMMRQGAMNCLNLRNFDQRAKCFDDISKPVSQKYGHDFFEGPSCRPGMDALKQEVLAKEKQKYPKQASALEARRGDDGGRDGGPGNQNFSPEDCKWGVAKMEKRANKCLKRKKFNRRKKCMDKVHKPVKKKYGDGFFESPSCRPGRDALKAKIIALEKAKYPNQPSALEDGGRDDRDGGGNNGPGNMNFSPEDCKWGIAKMEKRANKCLKRKKFAKRKKCMDNVHQPVKKKFGDGFFESPSCRPGRDALKAKIIAQEKAKYPKQPSALDDGGRDDRGGDNNDGGSKGFAEADCRKGVKMMEKRANKCLKRKKFNRRKKCMDKVHEPTKKKYGNAFFEGPSCRPMLDGLKAKIQAEEKAKYPDQGSALDD